MVTGHSLGAGLAAIGSTWFALQWPAADVTCINFGAAPTRTGTLCRDLLLLQTVTLIRALAPPATLDLAQTLALTFAKVPT